jgi:protein-tyrosine phosphatase
MNVGRWIGDGPCLTLGRSAVSPGRGEPMPQIVVVCTGNLNRSPFAAALLARSLPDRFAVSSGGFAAADRPSPQRMIDAAAEHGIDLSKHRSRRLTVDDVEGADLVLCMDRSHPVRIAELSRRAPAVTFTLPEALARFPTVEAPDLAGVVAAASAGRSVTEFLRPRHEDVEDPMGRNAKTHRRVAAGIVDMVERLVSIIPTDGA